MTVEEINLDQLTDLLRATPVCEGLHPDALRDIAAQLTVRPFAAGETLATPGAEVTEFWVVAKGEIEAYLTGMRGRESLLSVVHSGETLGEVAIMEKSPRPLRFTARTDGVLFVTSAEVFRQWIDAYPPLLRNLFRLLSLRFKEAVGIHQRKVPSPRLGIVARSPRGQLLAARLVRRLLATKERVRVWTDNPSRCQATGCWPESLAVQELAENDQPLTEAIVTDVDRRVVIWSSLPDPARLLPCDEVLWLLEPKDATSADLNLPADVQEKLADKVRIVWLLDSNAPVAPLLPRSPWNKSAIKAHVEAAGGAPHRMEQLGLDRLVRALRGYTIGIALAGGGAKGMAHLGVLKVLEQAGISFDTMSGTSAGAMAGICYAMGMEPSYAVDRFQSDLTPSPLFQMLPKWPNLYLVRKFRTRAWDAMLRKYFYDWRLEQLPIPFHSVTVDLVQVRPVVRSEGDAVHAILESINLPVVSPPILRDGMVLVDGGVLNNLPADVLVDRGVDFVVGVDVATRIRHEFAGNRPDTPTGQMRPASALDTLFRIFEAQAHNIGNIRNRAVDFWITPDTSGYGLAEFNRTREIAAAGERAAEQKLAELQRRLAELEQRLFAKG